MPNSENEAKSAAVHRLKSQGVDPSTIAYGLDLSPGEVKAILEGREYLPDEEEIDVLGRRLAVEAINEARKIMRTGPASQRIPMIKALLGNVTKSLGKDSGNDYEALREAMDEMLSNMRPKVIAPKVIAVEEGEIIEGEYDEGSSGEVLSES